MQLYNHCNSYKFIYLIILFFGLFKNEQTSNSKTACFHGTKDLTEKMLHTQIPPRDLSSLKTLRYTGAPCVSIGRFWVF